MRRLALLAVLALLLYSVTPASASPVLFDSYAFGTPRAELEKVPGMEKGEGEMASDLILPAVKWAGMDWAAQFIFEQDQLVNVTLLGAYERARFDAVRKELTGNSFEILGFVVDQKALDLFQLIKAGGVEAFQKRFGELIREKTPERVSYEFFQTKGVSEDQKKMVNSMNEFLRVVDMNILQAEVTMLGDGKGSGPQALLVSFFCPVLNVVKGEKK